MQLGFRADGGGWAAFMADLAALAAQAPEDASAFSAWWLSFKEQVADLARAQYREARAAAQAGAAAAAADLDALYRVVERGDRHAAARWLRWRPQRMQRSACGSVASGWQRASIRRRL